MAAACLEPLTSLKGNATLCDYPDYAPFEVTKLACSIDFEPDDSPEIEMPMIAQRESGTTSSTLGLRPLNDVDLLITRKGGPPFRAGDIISTNSVAHRDPANGEAGGDPKAALIMMVTYYAKQFPPTFRFDYDIAPGVLSFYYGLRQVRDDGLHMGWVHIRRESTNAGAFYRIVDYAYNPVPDVPVVAGVHPPGPELVTTPFDGGIQFSWGLRVGDNPALRLEWSATLTPPEWRPVEGGTASPVTLPVGNESAFFRLAVPPP